MTNEEAKSELMQLYGSLSEEKKKALDVLMAQAEKTCDIEKSNFDVRQYKLDTDTAYECGYNAGLQSQADGEYIRRSDVIKAVDKHTIDTSEIVLDEDITVILEELPSVAIPSVKPQEPKTDDMTSSHSELDIYKGCIDLMNDLLRQVYEWLEIVGIDVSEMDEDEQFATHFYTTEIVKRLFLWKTSHSGGTSQRMKLKELGITDDAVLFDFAKMIEPQESEEV